MDELYHSVTEEARDVMAGNMVPIILSAENRRTLGQLKRTLGQISRATYSELPLVNGIAAWVGKNQLERLFDRLPHGSHVAINHPLHQEDPFTSHDFIFQEAEDDTSTAGPTETAATRLPGLDSVHRLR
jgi:hypothetical protein